MAPRLNRETLQQLKETGAPKGVVLPQYDPADISSSIVHFGPSNFARAHLAVYAQKLIEAGHNDCGIIAVSPKLADGFNNAANNRTLVRQQELSAQDNLFSVWVKDGQTDQVDIIGSITDVLVGPNDVQKVIDTMVNPKTKLVTMTITQEGYYYDATDGVNLNAEDIAHSLKNVDSPRATVAYLVLALEARMNAGMPSFGVMSLDNMEENSEKLRRTVLAYAGKKSASLRDWIRDNTPFYSTSVDRIVPKPTPDKVNAVSSRLGFEDSQALTSEPYMHLVIGKSPYGPQEMREPPIPLNKVGATYVDDAEPYVLAKLRILNGAHMALGVVGRLSAENYADEALQDPCLKQYIDQYIREAAGTLAKLDHVDLDEYRLTTIERMGNAFMHDELVRLARNGSDKIDSRFISPLHDAYAHDLPRAHIVKALASWVKYIASANEDASIKKDVGDTYFIEDSKGYEKGYVDLARSLNGDVSPMLSIDGLFGGLEKNPQFVKEFKAAYQQISGYRQDQDFGVKSTPFTSPEVA